MRRGEELNPGDTQAVGGGHGTRATGQVADPSALPTDTAFSTQPTQGTDSSRMLTGPSCSITDGGTTRKLLLMAGKLEAEPTTSI